MLVPVVGACLVMLLMWPVDGEAVHYTRFNKVETGNMRKSLEMYIGKNQKSDSIFPSLTTARPSQKGRQGRKQKKQFHRRRRKKKQQGKAGKIKKTFVGHEETQTNNIDSVHSDRVLEASATSSTSEKFSNVSKTEATVGVNTNVSIVEEVNAIDNGDSIIGGIAQQVSDTFSMKKHLTKYKALPEHRRQRQLEDFGMF